MSKIYHVDLSDSERKELQIIVNRRTSSAELYKRSQILLACDRLGDQKWSDAKISKTYLVSIRTIERLRERFVEEGLSVALKGKARLNLDKIKFDGAVESQLVALRCSDAPEGSSGWTLRLLGDKLVELKVVESISHESVRQLLKKTKLSPGELPNG
ncbi:MAG: helix-turn-helix domain-containing protein [Bacteroidales bacterium]